MNIDDKELHWLSWLNKIEEAKRKYEMKPVDAQLYNPLQVVPGYNGVKINVEKSLKNLERAGRWHEEELVIEEVEPYLSITDFIPAPIFHGNPNKKIVSIMITVAWGNEYIPQMLECFNKEDAKATFFFDGSWLNRYPRLGKSVLDNGHEIGSHGYSHPDMRGMKVEGILWELRETNKVIERELALKPKVFTPPSGEYDDRVVYLAAQEDMRTILSTIDTEDWSNPGEEYILEKVKNNIRNGAIILMHPTKLTVSVLPKIIKFIKENQFNIGTVSDLISMKHIV